MAGPEETDKAKKSEENGSCASTSSGPQNLTLNTNKAGMEGLDTEKINEIIKNASEGSRFYQFKQKRQQELDVKLAQMKEAAMSFTDKQIKDANKQMDQLMYEFEAGRDLSHTIVHIDMDMFYAAVEMRDDPSLRDKPMAVGGTGMLSTSNYAARRYGVRAAMPGFIGKKLCANLIIVPPHFDKYKEVSRQVQEVMAEYDPNFCPMSLDEAYLDITEYLHNNYQDHSHDLDMESVAQTVVAEMREKIHTKTQLTASAGIAPNTRLAKVCSDINKPNGQYYLPPDLETIQQFVSRLPIRKVNGIGNVTEQHLHALGITQCSHLIEKRGLLRLLFSDTSYHSFMNIAQGLGHTTLNGWTEKGRKSISTETTFKGTSDREALFRLTENLCRELAEEMEQKDIWGKVFTLKLKTTDFQTRSRAQTLSDGTRSLEILSSTAHRLLVHEMNASENPLSLRLIGVRMSTLMNMADIGTSRQATLTQMFSKAMLGKVSHHSTTSATDSLQVDAREDVPVSVMCSDLSERNMPNVKTLMENGKSDLLSELPVHDKAMVKGDTNIHSKKKMVSMDYFLTKPKENSGARKMEDYECSVCGKQVRVRNLEEFNKHLDLCLEIHASPNTKINLSSTGENNQRLSLCPNSKNTAECKSDVIHNEPKTKQSFIKNWSSKESILDKDSVNVQDHTEVSGSIVPEGSDSQQDYLCPVCHQKNFSDVESLTKHVDDCLSTNTICQMMQDTDELQGESSKKTIDKSQKLMKVQHKDASQPPSKGKRKGSSSVRSSKKVKGPFNTLDRYFL